MFGIIIQVGGSNTPNSWGEWMKHIMVKEQSLDNVN